MSEVGMEDIHRVSRFRKRAAGGQIRPQFPRVAGGLLPVIFLCSLFELSHSYAKPPKALQSKPPEVKVDSGGRKWLGNIPYDVFFDDPLGIAADATATGAPRMASSNSTNANTVEPSGIAPSRMVEPKSENKNDSATGSIDWNKLISADELAEEAKQVRIHLTSCMKSVGQYNGNYKEIQTDGAVISGLAGIALRHPDPVPWKERAVLIGEVGVQLRASSQGLGKESFDKSRASYEKLDSLFSGSTPPGLPKDLADDRPFSEFASRGGLMQRMNKAFEWLKSNMTTESKLKAEQERAQREAAILAAFTQIISDERYDSAIEDDYKKYARAMLDTSRETSQAIRDLEFSKFRTSMDTMKKRCDECHSSYGTQ